MDDSYEEDDMEKEVAFLAKKSNGKPFSKEKFSSPRVTRRSLRRKMGRSFNPLKELCVMNAIAMSISKRSVLTT